MIYTSLNISLYFPAQFDGDDGETMKRVCATFNQNQKAALEILKAREKKDTRWEKFKADAESNPLCQRLPLSGLISTGFQRLTKYPLLIENLLKYSQGKYFVTPDVSTEAY